MTTNNALFTLENTTENRQFLKKLQSLCRQNVFGIRIRGRGPRKASMVQSRDIPLRLSKRLSVYVYEKPRTKWVKVVDLTESRGFRYVQRPTKWY